jgi:hypothetical protein
MRECEKDGPESSKLWSTTYERALLMLCDPHNISFLKALRKVRGIQAHQRKAQKVAHNIEQRRGRMSAKRFQGESHVADLLLFSRGTQHER